MSGVGGGVGWGGGGGSGSAWFRFLSLVLIKSVTASGGVGGASPADPALLLHCHIVRFYSFKLDS